MYVLAKYMIRAHIYLTHILSSRHSHLLLTPVAKFKEKQALKRTGGTKKAKVTGIAKLDDANFAGGAKSRDCTLILTEGDSAKSLAMSGISVVGRDYYGVFPLKGKPLNVRDAKLTQVMNNEEIKNSKCLQLYAETRHYFIMISAYI